MILNREIDMEKFEEYIKMYREAFDDKELPEGHLDRFERRLDTLDTRSRRPYLWLMAAGIAAVVAAIVFLRLPESGQRDWFAGVGVDQVDICETYYSNVADIYEDLFSSGTDAELGLLAESVVDETSPLIDLLPDEMGAEEKAAVLKEYYGELLDALLKINNIK